MTVAACILGYVACVLAAAWVGAYVAWSDRESAYAFAMLGPVGLLVVCACFVHDESCSLSVRRRALREARHRAELAALAEVEREIGRLS